MQYCRLAVLFCGVKSNLRKHRQSGSTRCLTGNEVAQQFTTVAPTSLIMENRHPHELTAVSRRCLCTMYRAFPPCTTPFFVPFPEHVFHDRETTPHAIGRLLEGSRAYNATSVRIFDVTVRQSYMTTRHSYSPLNKH